MVVCVPLLQVCLYTELLSIELQCMYCSSLVKLAEVILCRLPIGLLFSVITTRWQQSLYFGSIFVKWSFSMRISFCYNVRSLW